MTTRAVRRLAVAVLACCATTLTACGSDLSPDVHPGAAAVIGDDEITLDEVDDFTDNICDWQQHSGAGNGQAFPMAFLRALSVEHLVNSRVVDLYAEEHDLEADKLGGSFAKNANVDTVDGYRELVVAEAQASDNVDEDEADAAISLFMSDAIINSVSLAAGLAEDPSLDEDAAIERGTQLIAEWREAQDIDIDPRFGSRDAESQAGYVPPSDTLSVLSGEAPASESFFTPEYVDGLPESQRCG